MNKAQITDNDILRDEIKALYNYTNRDNYSLYVVKVMLNGLEYIVKAQLNLVKEGLENGKRK